MMKAEERLERKEALKKLREERRDAVERARARVARTNDALKKIKAELTRGPRTVPEIAMATGLPTDETLWYVMALKKYGEVAEGAKPKGQSYYPYELIIGSDPLAKGIDQ